MKRALIALAALLLALVGLVLIGAPAHADDTTDTPVDAVEPDWDTQPDWAHEWRVHDTRVICHDDGTGARVETLSMWRPAEPSWDGAEWVTYDTDEWSEWAWPDASDWRYADLQPGDCTTPDGPVDVPADPGPIEEPATPAEHPTELAETGAPPSWLGWGAGVIVAAGIGLVLHGRRTHQ